MALNRGFRGFGFNAHGLGGIRGKEIRVLGV